MEKLVDVVRKIGSGEKNDDDTADRLSNRYTVMLIVVFAVIISAQMYVGSPVTCWVDKHFTGPWTKYTNDYCWVKNTYYLPYEEPIPEEGIPESDKRMIPYYQWVPFILALQAFLFYAPSAFWHSLNQGGGVDADRILQLCNGFEKKVDKKVRETTLNAIRTMMHRFLGSRKAARNKKVSLKESISENRNMGWRRFGCYLVIIYCISKFLYLVNVVGQLFMLNSILALDYHIYGIEVFRWMLDNYDWTTSPQVAFPRVTMCDFKVRRLGNIHRYTVQCTLPINLYNEKIYMFLWFWMVFVAVVTAVSLVTWIARIVSVTDRERYIQNHLKMMGKIDKSGKDVDDDTRRFVRSYLRHDGVFLLRLIGHNTNTLTVSEIIGALWDNRPQHLRAPPLKSTHEEDPSDPDSHLPLKPGAESTA